jgi:hypothetical protein
VSLRLWLLERYVPGPIRRQLFGRLVHLTADAFGVPAPDIVRLPRADAIQRFAEFTRREAERVLGAGVAAGSASTRQRLHDGARSMGATVRRLAGIRSHDEALRALRLLYAAIGIELRAEADGGGVCIVSCAFSQVYTPEVCDFVSSLDAGLFDGLSGGLVLVFEERITEGAAACRAVTGTRTSA